MSGTVLKSGHLGWPSACLLYAGNCGHWCPMEVKQFTERLIEAW